MQKCYYAKDVEQLRSALKVAIAQLEIYEGAIKRISGREDFLKCGLSHLDWESCDKFDFRNIAEQAKIDAEKLGDGL